MPFLVRLEGGWDGIRCGWGCDRGMIIRHVGLSAFLAHLVGAWQRAWLRAWTGHRYCRSFPGRGWGRGWGAWLGGMVGGV